MMMKPCFLPLNHHGTLDMQILRFFRSFFFFSLFTPICVVVCEIVKALSCVFLEFWCLGKRIIIHKAVDSMKPV